jgi:hypothetical protein
VSTFDKFERMAEQARIRLLTAADYPDDLEMIAEQDATTRALTESQHAAQSDWPEVTRVAAHVSVSCCVLTDSTGANHCKHPPPPTPPWHRRIRYRLADRWRRLRERVGYAIAGRDPMEDE